MMMMMMMMMMMLLLPFEQGSSFPGPETRSFLPRPTAQRSAPWQKCLSCWQRPREPREPLTSGMVLVFGSLEALRSCVNLQRIPKNAVFLRNKRHKKMTLKVKLLITITSQSHHTFLLNVLLVDLLKVKLCFLVARATGGGHSCEDC